MAVIVNELDDPLDRNGLDRDTVTAYIGAVVRSNWTKTAKVLQISRYTVNRNSAFHEMKLEERGFVITTVFEELGFHAKDLYVVVRPDTPSVGRM